MKCSNSKWEWECWALTKYRFGNQHFFIIRFIPLHLIALTSFRPIRSHKWMATDFSLWYKMNRKWVTLFLRGLFLEQCILHLRARVRLWKETFSDIVVFWFEEFDCKSRRQKILMLIRALLEIWSAGLTIHCSPLFYVCLCEWFKNGKYWNNANIFAVNAYSLLEHRMLMSI